MKLRNVNNFVMIVLRIKVVRRRFAKLVKGNIDINNEEH